MECNYCKNILSTKSSLKLHQTTAKFCLKLQGVKNIKELFCCELCGKDFQRKLHLNKHKNICESVKKENKEKENKENSDSKKENSDLKKEKEDKENRDLKKEKEDKENRDLKKEKEDKENRDLKKENSDLKKEKEDLKNEIDDLKNENSEINFLKYQINYYKINNEKLNKRVDEFMSEYKKSAIDAINKHTSDEDTSDEDTSDEIDFTTSSAAISKFVKGLDIGSCKKIIKLICKNNPN
jgi:chromosome segregation ATPase